MAGSLSLLLPRPSSRINAAFVQKWLVIMFLISVWWTVQLAMHTTISDFHINRRHQRLLPTAAAAPSSPASSPAHVVDSTWSFLEKQQGGVNNASSYKMQMQQQVQEEQRIIRAEQEKHHRVDTSSSSTSKKDKKKVTLREIFEETHNPNDWQRIRSVVDSLRVPMPATPTLDVPYDIFNCPSDAPPLDYPHHWPMRKILAEWNPASVDMPAQIHQSICIFDWDKDYYAIVKYRQAEVPFIVQNHPDLMRTSERWMSGQIHLQNKDNDVSSSPEQQQGKQQKKSYLEKMIGKHKQYAEHSDSNQFIYWKPTLQTKRDLTWKPPTQEINLSYHDWYQRAMDLDKKAAATTSSSNSSSSHVSFDHWYFRVNDKGDEEKQFLYDELPIFQPNQEYQDFHPKNNVFMVEPEHAEGINCRFGMRGVLAAAHYDSHLNWVVLMGGQRRYILSHPRECPNLHLYPTGHASARHSSVDWTNVTSYDSNETDAILQDAKGTEVVLQAAHALYLPSFWFHFIVSLNINYQCNARSGRSYIDSDPIAKCGFQALAINLAKLGLVQ